MGWEIKDHLQHAEVLNFQRQIYYLGNISGLMLAGPAILLTLKTS